MKNASWVKIIILIALATLTWKVLAGEASVSVSVNDEQGAPIHGAKVTASWYGVRAPGSGWGLGDVKSVSAISDELGKCNLSVGGGEGGIVATREGFYRRGVGPEYEKQFAAPLNAMNHVNVTIVLVKKKKPSPMFVRRIEWLEIPTLAVSIGFDLVDGAWVTPYGKGRHSDWVIVAKQEVRGRNDEDHSLEISFPGSDAGIQLIERPFRSRNCELRLPPEAPEAGYEAKLEKKGFRRIDGKVSNRQNDENANYIFRISRPKDDAPGSPVQTMYGKIHGDIKMSAGETQAAKPAIAFVYYLNPDGTRSLEWDTVKNLAAERENRVNPEP